MMAKVECSQYICCGARCILKACTSAVSMTILCLLVVVANSANNYHTVYATYNKNAPRGQHGLIKCFECRSDLNPHCRDPFNYTDGIRSKKLPVVDCLGMACVKVVTNYRTDNQTIWRACSSSKMVDITPTLVHVGICLGESNGSGHMCFCDESFCNAAADTHKTTSQSFLLMLLCSLAIIVFHRTADSNNNNNFRLRPI